MEFDHLTAIVGDADAAASVLERLLGVPPAASLALPGMAIRSFRFAGGEINVNAPTGPGLVADHLQRAGAGFHHLALRVPDLDAALVALRERGLPAVGEPIETAPGLREVFLDPRATAGLMIQLVERREPDARGQAVDGDAVGRLAEQAR